MKEDLRILGYGLVLYALAMAGILGIALIFGLAFRAFRFAAGFGG